jgi:hypothetical protein
MKDWQPTDVRRFPPNVAVLLWWTARPEVLAFVDRRRSQQVR